MNSNFFLVTPLGFEQLAQEELQVKLEQIKKITLAPHYQEWLQKEEVWEPSLILNSCKKIDGGIEFTAPLYLGLWLNQFLKIPVRILLRISQFKCTDFPKLFERLSKVDWRLYCSQSEIEFSVSSQASKLKIKSRMEEVAQSAFKKYLEQRPAKKSTSPLTQTTQIFIRLDQDLCTLSYNTSGEPLYKRGVRELIGEAPLRENLAAGLLFYTKKILSQNVKTSTKNFTLIDPMCGSGVFLLESQNFFNPSVSREFHYQTSRVCPDLLKRNLFAKVDINSDTHTEFYISPLFKNAVGIEKDEPTFLAAQKNVIGFDDIQIKNADFFGTNAKEIKLKAGANDLTNHSVFITNPPYNQRLKITDSSPQLFYSRLASQMAEASPEAFALIIPQEFTAPKVTKYLQKPEFKFSNGGISVRYCLFLRQT